MPKGPDGRTEADITKSLVAKRVAEIEVALPAMRQPALAHNLYGAGYENDADALGGGFVSVGGSRL